MSRKSAERKFANAADPHQAELVKLLKQFGYAHQINTVFADFVEISAIALSNNVDKPQFERREKRYLEIVGKYKPEELQMFARMFAELTLSFEHRLGVDDGLSPGALPCPGNLTDVLGETYMMLEIGNDRAGQFFTPYSISRLMAGISIGSRSEVIEQEGFVRMQEPACGAGGMVIATADALLSIGQNYQQTMHATCIDIDARCVKYWRWIAVRLRRIPMQSRNRQMIWCSTARSPWHQLSKYRRSRQRFPPIRSAISSTAPSSSRGPASLTLSTSSPSSKTQGNATSTYTKARSLIGPFLFNPRRCRDGQPVKANSFFRAFR
ncbi:N-6 DNA methylase [Burkholderia pseudomallei]|uniref:N-6 DNA methylase n=1 Tax=Burkholderia pseudomallei TaxID=28450 RepID=UPI001EF32572|nr:N-6 DNA methylase [Burkholderia pseudomallei]